MNEQTFNTMIKEYLVNNLGEYSTPEEASSVRENYAKDCFGEFYRKVD